MFIETQIQNIEDEIARAVKEMEYSSLPEEEKDKFLNRLFYVLEGRLMKYT
jgi:hypothetical protein